MACNAQRVFNAAEVADAVFSGMMQRKDMYLTGDDTPDNLEAVQRLIESIDVGLKAAGLTFAEYLERIRHARQNTMNTTDLRWRFSARERAVQRVDHAVSHLCALMQHSPLNC